MRTSQLWSSVLVLGLTAMGCTTGTQAIDPPIAVEPRTSVPAPHPATAPAVPAVPSILGHAVEDPPAPTVPLYPAAGLTAGDEGVAVVQLQSALNEAGFRTGDAIDGLFGPATTSAVLAFEKYHGLDRDGVADPDMLDALGSLDVVGPPVRTGGPAIDIDLERQLLFARTSDGELTILNTSTGNGELYRSASGRLVTATTPVGEFRIERRIDGVRRAFLGSLYRPLYFERGWAIHGSSSVPAYPASHGCARVRNDDQDWLFESFRDGVPVTVHSSLPPATVGSEHATFQ